MKSRRKIQMICVCMAMLTLVGCTAGGQAEAEPMNVIPLAELDGEGVADWNFDSSEEDNSEVPAEEATEEISEEINEEESTEEEELSVEESLKQNGWARVPENTEFVLGKDMKFRLADDRLVKGDQSVIFGDVYGTVYRAYVMEPQEGQYYMLLETWDYMQLREDYVLVYQLTENEMVLCQEIYGGSISDIISADTVRMGQVEKDFGLTRTFSTYRLDKSTKTFVSTEEWKEVNRYITAEEKEIPIWFNGEETLLPVGSSVRMVETNLQGHIIVEIEETGERGDFFYETDGNGRILIGGEPAGAYFEKTLVTEFHETNLQERAEALKTAGEGGFAVMCESVEQGERYTYHITDYCVSLGGVNEKRIIEIYERERLIQTIEQSWVTPVYLSAIEERVWEQDADFDGVEDIVFFDCYTGNQGAALYSCYLSRGGKFVECESFYGIFNPRFDKENKVISSFSRGSAISYSMSYYRYDGTEFVRFREDNYEVNEEVGVHIMEDVHPFWNYMMVSEDLSEEEEKEMQRFYPVFCSNKEMTLWYGGMEVIGTTTFDGIAELFLEEEGATLQYLYEFAFVDMTGDGQKELVMRCGDLGSSVFVLLEDDGEFYISYFGIRWMQIVYEDGMYRGSGGAGTWGYLRLFFEDGKLRKEEIASHNMRDIHVEDAEDIVVFEGNVYGEEVNLEEFLLWEVEHTDNEVEWNEAVIF
ncbi:MAG: hypothetical protein J6A80_05865 [Lachnospiraceae bacterium]|nr:hypothetical protein [Lachnospiraceae bacterium]